MRILVLGHGKTGRLVAEVAHERGHGVHVLDAKENPNGAALTGPFIAGFDVVIDFTTPSAVVGSRGGGHDRLVRQPERHARPGTA